MSKSKCIAIIPARGGSKGLVNKNIKFLCGKPLIAWTIEAALQCEFITKVIVNTDSKNIAKIALKYGAEVPFIRPSELGDDSATSSDVIQHTVEQLQLENETILLLQPTSPLRTKTHISEAFKKFTKDCSDSLVSISPLDKNPLWSYWLDNNKITPVCETEKVSTLRQDLPPAYALNGAIYIFTVDFFKKNNAFFNNKSNHFIMNKSSSIDIDDKIDFELAKIIMEQK
jgi:CMP-N,N'-diacetyllegionaminic acid synthase